MEVVMKKVQALGSTQVSRRMLLAGGVAAGSAALLTASDANANVKLSQGRRPIQHGGEQWQKLRLLQTIPRARRLFVCRRADQSEWNLLDMAKEDGLIARTRRLALSR
jgi:hypothetical protein